MRLYDMLEFTFAQWGSPVPPTFGAGFASLNTGIAQIQGVDISAVFKGQTGPIKWDGFIGYTLTSSKALEPEKVYAKDSSGNELSYKSTSYNSENLRLKYRPLHQFKWDLMMEYQKFYFGLGGLFQSVTENVDAAFLELPLTLFVQGIDTSMQENKSIINTLNVRIGMKIRHNMNISIIVDNLTNQEYHLRPGIIGPPRLARLQFQYRISEKRKK
jgi:outer membrane receptor protein involved in Fe transport